MNKLLNTLNFINLAINQLHIPHSINSSFSHLMMFHRYFPRLTCSKFHQVILVMH